MGTRSLMQLSGDTGSAVLDGRQFLLHLLVLPLQLPHALLRHGEFLLEVLRLGGLDFAALLGPRLLGLEPLLRLLQAAAGLGGDQRGPGAEVEVVLRLARARAVSPRVCEALSKLCAPRPTPAATDSTRKNGEWVNAAGASNVGRGGV